MALAVFAIAAATSMAGCATKRGMHPAPTYEVPDLTGPFTANDPLERLKALRNLVWNAWVERVVVSGQREMYYNPVSQIQPGSRAIVGLQLSDALYVGDGMVNAAAEPEFVQQVQAWVETGQREVTLTAILIVDQAYFDGPAYIQQPFRVNLASVRKGLDKRKRGLARGPSVFGEVSFSLRAKSVTGVGRYSILIWDDQNRPLDELSGAVCLGRSCPNMVATSDRGVRGLGDMVKDSSPLDAVIHIFGLGPGSNAEMVGLMHTRTSKLTWRLNRSQTELRALLSDSLFQAFARSSTDDDWLLHGRALREALFPSGDSDAVHAFSQLEALVTTKSARRPRVYMRVLDGGGTPMLFPLGAVTIADSLLGVHAEVVTPLRVPLRTRTTSCVSEWNIVAPPLGAFEGDALGDARRAAATTIDKWRDGASWRADSLAAFGAWLANDQPVAPQHVSFVLSHHDVNGNLRFAPTDVLTPTSVQRSVTAPSVVILNACGTGQVSPVSFVDEFNKRGATAVIATMTEVEASLAADFTNCLAAQFENASRGGVRLSQAFRQTIACVSGMHEGVVSKHGYSVYKYMLLGDSEVTVCGPSMPR